MTGIASSLEVFANLARVQDQPERAARLWASAAALRELIGCSMLPGEAELFDQQVAQARAATSEEAFAAAWAEGRVITMQDAIAYALEVNDAHQEPD